MFQLSTRMSWCIRRFWMSNIARTLGTGAGPGSEEEQILRKAQDFLDSLTGDMKKQLEIIEMEYEIRMANNEPVPSHLTSKQKKAMILFMKTKEERLKYLYNLKNLEKTHQSKKEYLCQTEEELQFGQDIKKGTFIYANESTYNVQFYKSRMAQTFNTGMPIVYDVGYPMCMTDNWSFIKMLSYSYKEARMHKQPAHLIVSGLGKNRVLKEMLQDRKEAMRMMVDFRDEAYWEIFPELGIVYMCDRGPELTEVDGEKLHVIYCGRRRPKLTRAVETRTFPYHRSLFAGSKSLMLECKSKILMDLSLEKDIEKVYCENMEAGLFKKYMSTRKYEDFKKSKQNKTELQERQKGVSAGKDQSKEKDNEELHKQRRWQFLEK